MDKPIDSVYCVHCGKLFKPHHTRQKLCSSKCRNERNVQLCKIAKQKHAEAMREQADSLRLVKFVGLAVKLIDMYNAGADEIELGQYLAKHTLYLDCENDNA